MQRFHLVPGLPGLSPTALRYTLGAAALMLLFMLWPRLDILVTGLFYTPEKGFLLESNPLADRLRMALWNLSILVALSSLAALLLGFLPIPRLRRWRGRFLAIVLGYSLSTGLLVNGIFKSYWGRARPTDIAEFGGAHHFTPPIELADQCARNCSFVSGEASGSVMTAIALGLLLWPLVAPQYRTPLLVTLTLIAATGSLLRVAMGGHFLSDVLFSALLTAAVAQWAIWLCMGRREA